MCEIRIELSLQQARLTTARAALARVRPLAEENALSQKELDSAIGEDKATAAAVEADRSRLIPASLREPYLFSRAARNLRTATASIAVAPCAWEPSWGLPSWSV